MAETDAQAPPRAVPGESHWGLVVLLGCLTAFAPLSIDLYLPALPAIARGLSADPGQAQATVAAFIGGMAFGQVFYGPASDRYGRRGPLLVGLAIYVAASVVCALATGPAMLIGARFVQALGGCAGGVIARAVIRDHFDHTETARMLSLMGLISGLAPMLAPLAGGLLVTWFDWRANFWVLTLFGVLTTLAAALRLKESRSEATAAQALRESPLAAYLALLRQRRLMGYALAGALNGATLFSYVSSSSSLIIGTYGVAPANFGWIFGLNGAALLVSGQLNRVILKHATPDRVLVRAGAVALGFGFLLTVAAVTGVGGPFTVLPLLFCIMASYGFIQGNTTAGALSVDPKRAGSTSALLGAFSFGAGAAAAAVVAALHDGTARPMAIVMFLALAGSAAALNLMAIPRRA